MKAVTMSLSKQQKMGINMNSLHYICLALLKSQSLCVLVDQSLSMKAGSSAGAVL